MRSPGSWGSGSKGVAFMGNRGQGQKGAQGREAWGGRLVGPGIQRASPEAGPWRQRGLGERGTRPQVVGESLFRAQERGKLTKV